MSVKRLRRSSRRSQSATTLQLGSRCHWKEAPKPPPTIPILTCFSDAPGPIGPAELADNGEASRRLAAVRATADPPNPSRNFLRASGPFLFLDIVDTSFRDTIKNPNRGDRFREIGGIRGGSSVHELTRCNPAATKSVNETTDEHR